MTRFALAAVLVVSALLAPTAPAHASWSWPLRGEVITTYRNGGDPYAAGQHRGIDIAGPVGTAVVAAIPGEVRFAGVAGTSGLTVSVRTSDGRFDTSYLHLSTTAVKTGEHVQAGQRLGAVGTSGRRSAPAPHLHFGVRDAGSQRYHDPLGLLPPLATAPQPRPEAPPTAVPLPAAPAPTALRVPASAPRPLPAATPGRRPATEPRRQGAARRPPVARPRPHPTMQRRPAPAPEPQRVPAVPPRRLPASAPRELPAAAARSHPAVSPQSSSSPHRHGRRLDGERQRRPASVPVDSRRGLHLDKGTEGSSPSSIRPRHVEPAAASPSRGSGDGAGGPDAGWALACLGLLVAAALVGTSGGGRDAARRGRTAVQRVLAPLAGRG